MALESPDLAKKIRVQSPSGKAEELTAASSGKVSFTGTDDLGVYEATADTTVFRRFAVNLFDIEESNIAAEPNQSIQIGYVEVAGQPGWEVARREIWKGLLLLGLAVLLLEWYIYNRRVYL